MKLAFICRGKSDSGNGQPLQYLENSCNAVEKILTQHEWQCENVELEKLDDYATTLQNHTNKEEVSEFIFYFIGHGDYTTDLDFHILLEGETTSPYIEHIVNKTKSSCSELPSKMAIIIDSCYSGKAIKPFVEKGYYKHIEILTSSSDDEKSYESSSLEDGRTVFSHYFCEAIKNDKLQFSDIKKYVYSKTEMVTINKNTEDENRVSQRPYYTLAQERERIIIGYNKEINEIYKVLNEKYPMLKDFQKAILSYMKNDAFNFKEIQDLEEKKQLFQKLLEERECLYCLLYELDLHLKYAHRVNKVEDCKKYREEIAKTRTIKGIVLVIQKGTNSKITDCSVSCHQEKSDGTYNLNFASLSKIDFSKGGNYEKEIGVLLSDILKNISLSDEILELKLILPEELFSVDFFSIKVKAKFNEKNILEVFNISKKILMRFTHYKEDGYFERWDNNQKRFNTLKLKSMEKQVLLLDEREKIPYFGKTLTQGEIKNKEKKKYLAVHSHYSLMEAEHIINMVEWGVPIVLSAKEDESFEVCWEECMVSDMKLVVSNHIHYNKNRFFIHDNYDEVVTLQEAIEKDIKEKKELRK